MFSKSKIDSIYVKKKAFCFREASGLFTGRNKKQATDVSGFTGKLKQRIV